MKSAARLNQPALKLFWTRPTWSKAYRRRTKGRKHCSCFYCCPPRERTSYARSRKRQKAIEDQLA